MNIAAVAGGGWTFVRATGDGVQAMIAAGGGGGWVVVCSDSLKGVPAPPSPGLICFDVVLECVGFFDVAIF